ncbi:class I SAM-dependent methyltransferase [bacterium]|nr:class I SAM-dependent methyltransferase [bacterium]
MMSNSERIALFDEWARNYDPSGAGANAFPFAGYDQVLNEIVDCARPIRSLSILDLGTGTGNLASLFAGSTREVWGIDFSSEMLAKSKAILPNCHFVQADLLGQWPEVLNRRFDRIVSAYVFHEFDIPTKVELLRRLKNDYLVDHGRMIIGDIAFPSQQIFDSAREIFAQLWDPDEYYWIADNAVDILSSMGMTVAYKQVSVCGGVFVIDT